MKIDSDILKLLTLDIPEYSKKEDGFLEIIQMSHYENVNSRVYAYFLEQKNNEKIAKSFLSALQELIKEKSEKEIEISEYICLAEDVTIKGNRIDITLNDTKNRSAIIIENKIYHHLDNDLMDYWNHFNYPNENKLGVLLTLNEHYIPEYVKDYFVNITHLEWISKVQELGIPSGIPHKFYVYLNDFFQTIENLSKNYEMNEQTEFYFEHASKILKAKETLTEAEKFINQQLQILASKLNLSVYGNSFIWRNLWDEKNKKKTFYTIIFNKLMHGEQKIQIIIELEREDKERVSELRDLLKDDELYLEMDRNSKPEKNYIHFAKRAYTLTTEEVKQFAETVQNLIVNDFDPVMNKIMNHIYPSK